jgi:hypothetical protein
MISWKGQILVFLLCLILAGCGIMHADTSVDTSSPFAETSQPLGLSSATLIYPTKSSTPRSVISTSTPPLTATTLATIPMQPDPLIVQTLSPAHEQKMAELLRVKGCELPCYLGITPGETSWEKAEAILSDLGAWPRNLGSANNLTENGWLIYPYGLYVGFPYNPNATPEAYARGINWLVLHKVNLTVVENQVERIQVELNATEFGEIYRVYWWTRYSLDEVLHRVGQPDTIFFKPIYQWQTFYTIDLIYNNVRAVVEYSGLKKDYHGVSICPLLPIEEGQVIGQEMILTDPASPLGIYLPGHAMDDLLDQYRPIQAVLGIDEAEFTRRLLADPSACFELNEVFDN